MGCGTKVDVGENEEYGKPKSDDAFVQQEGEDTPITSSGQPGQSGSGGSGAAGGAGGESGGGSGGSGGGYSLTCFGTNPVLPTQFQTWCDNMDENLASIFAEHVDYICNQKKLVNLTYEACAWNGTSDISKYKRTFSDTQDTSVQDYSFFAAYSLTAHKTTDEFRDLYDQELLDPTGFEDDGNIQITNTTVTNQTKHTNGNYSYSVEFRSSAATISFSANIDYENHDGMMVVYDYDVADQVILKENRFLRFFIDQGDGTSRLIGLDAKIIGDGGNHAITRQNVLNVLELRMRKDYENSTN
jgi:hypothetical protein